MSVVVTEAIFEQEDVRKFKLRPLNLGPITQGQLMVRIDKFGVTSNNVSYLATGRSLRYFDFFPVSGEKPGQYGTMPVWGFGTVIKSLSPLVAEGERLWGYWPCASHCVLVPDPKRTTQASFVVRRDDLPADRLAYLTYSRVDKRALPTPSSPELEDHAMLLRGLWVTGFLLADYLAVKNNFSVAGSHPTKTVVIVSASSKTGYSLAFCLKQLAPTTEVIGLTSSRNKAFVQGTLKNLYDHVVTYQDIATQLPVRQGGCVIVDMAGDDDVTKKVYDRYGKGGVRQTVRVGASHWSSPTPTVASFRPPNSHFFFAPGWSQERVKAIGPKEFVDRQSAVWDATMRAAAGWIDVHTATGPEEVKNVVAKVIAGDYGAKDGFVAAFGEGSGVKL
ncbi:hypothetical protein M427DRAFT_52762 [Gonapodya prolifera JEL478]|uniref:GroES-like protein n=1 Tax=Gonapodya prolifera (strain JEL478) TaxID=1344416 RepID=A0A139ATW8_GONPJ|nr:hypothetical protein M427DRAFT_52762 [Gonapodya prolifera JEL478]|eukprot:KXS19945.1 hypothetical protein M427DRAFT_52762 [Gonapodya prolifera JEL478]